MQSGVDSGTPCYLLVRHLAGQGSLPARHHLTTTAAFPFLGPHPAISTTGSYYRWLHSLIRTLAWITETLLMLNSSRIYFAIQAPCTLSQLFVAFLLMCTTPKKVSFRLEL